MTSKRCAWHKCGRNFVRQHNNQRYCCEAHKRKAAEFRKQRGGRVVSILIDNPVDVAIPLLRKIRKELLDEMKGLDT